MQTVTPDILNNKVVKLLQDLELLQLIRVRRTQTENGLPINWAEKHKGSMTKQAPTEIDNQLNELRNEWE